MNSLSRPASQLALDLFAVAVARRDLLDLADVLVNRRLDRLILEAPGELRGDGAEVGAALQRDVGGGSIGIERLGDAHPDLGIGLDRLADPRALARGEALEHVSHPEHGLIHLLHRAPDAGLHGRVGALGLVQIAERSGHQEGAERPLDQEIFGPAPRRRGGDLALREEILERMAGGDRRHAVIEAGEEGARDPA